MHLEYLGEVAVVIKMDITEVGMKM